jgi:putative flippase GtrA
MQTIKIPLLIPTFQPDCALENTVRELVQSGFSQVVVVDDGSDANSTKIIDNLRELDGVLVLQHKSNQGKGSAIKTGVSFIQRQFPDALGVITVDGDGQHLAQDVRKVGLASHHNPDCLILGSRSFPAKVPLRSRIGNDLTRLIGNSVFDLNVQDSQTGLRFLPRSFWEPMLALKGERYEFELDCLFLARDLGLCFKEIPITTVYTDGNSSSHFRPILDSLRIYAIFARFSVSGVLSFVIDMGVFLALTRVTGNVFLSAVSARCVSGVANFVFNKTFVFRRVTRARLSREVVGYLTLWGVMNFVSASLVSVVASGYLLGLAFAKVGIDLSLFVLSFWVQKRFIFRR